MRHFSIFVHSSDDVHAFVRLAMVQPFAVTVDDHRQQVNGKNFMGMFTLDLSQPLEVLVDCDEDSFRAFSQKATSLFAS